MSSLGTTIAAWGKGHDSLRQKRSAFQDTIFPQVDDTYKKRGIDRNGVFAAVIKWIKWQLFLKPSFQFQFNSKNNLLFIVSTLQPLEWMNKQI